MRKFPALGSALVLALTGAFVAAPALAHTHHPSTPQERQQTRDLNLQQLQMAQGQAPANQQAMNGQQTAPATQEQQAPAVQQQPAGSDQSGKEQTAPTKTPSGPAPADNSNQPAQQTPSNAPQQPAPSGY
jgi:hypothetical protein